MATSTKPMPPRDELITLAEAAKLFHMSQRSLKCRIQRGTLEAWKGTSSPKGGRPKWLIRRDADITDRRIKYATTETLASTAPMPPRDELITAAEAAELLGITSGGVASRIRLGTLVAWIDPDPACKGWRKWLIRRSDINLIDGRHGADDRFAADGFELVTPLNAKLKRRVYEPNAVVKPNGQLWLNLSATIMVGLTNFVRLFFNKGTGNIRIVPVNEQAGSFSLYQLGATKAIHIRAFAEQHNLYGNYKVSALPGGGVELKKMESVRIQPGHLTHTELAERWGMRSNYAYNLISRWHEEYGIGQKIGKKWVLTAEEAQQYKPDSVAQRRGRKAR